VCFNQKNSPYEGGTIEYFIVSVIIDKNVCR